MVKLTEVERTSLQQIRKAAERSHVAAMAVEALAVAAVSDGVPALHVADAAGIGRATLYRWIKSAAAEPSE